MILSDTSASPVSWQASAEALSGDGCTKMLFVPGNIEPGSFRVIQTLPLKLVASLTSTTVAGMKSRSETMNLSSPPTRKPAFKQEPAFTLAGLASRGLRCASNTNTLAVGHGFIWPLSMFIIVASSVVANQQTGSLLLTLSSIKS